MGGTVKRAGAPFRRLLRAPTFRVVGLGLMRRTCIKTPLYLRFALRATKAKLTLRFNCPVTRTRLPFSETVSPTSARRIFSSQDSGMRLSPETPNCRRNAPTVPFRSISSRTLCIQRVPTFALVVAMRHPFPKFVSKTAKI